MVKLSCGTHSLKAWVMVGLLALLVLGGLWRVAPSQAQNLHQLQQRQQQIQQQIRGTQRRLGELRQAEEEARRRMGSLRQNIQQTEASLRDNQYRLEQAQRALEQAQKELQELEDRLRRQQQGTAARLRYMQRQGAEHWWALLLTSRDLNEFFDRRHQLQLLIEADRQLIRELQVMAKEVDQQRIALEAQRNEISLILQELAAQKNQLQQQAAAQEQLVGRLANERAAYEAAQRRLEADSQQLTILIQQLIAQQAQQRGGQRSGSGDRPVDPTSARANHQRLRLAGSPHLRKPPLPCGDRLRCAHRHASSGIRPGHRHLRRLVWRLRLHGDCQPRRRHHHPVRPQQPRRRWGGSAGTAGAGHCRFRLHRPLHRPPRSLRGAGQRPAGGSPPLPLKQRICRQRLQGSRLQDPPHIGNGG